MDDDAPLSRPMAETFNEFILDAFFVKRMDYPNRYTLKEMCKEMGVKESWVRDWAKSNHDWQEIVALLDKEVELPKIRIDKGFE